MSNALRLAPHSSQDCVCIGCQNINPGDSGAGSMFGSSPEDMLWESPRESKRPKAQAPHARGGGGAAAAAHGPGPGGYARPGPEPSPPNQVMLQAARTLSELIPAAPVSRTALA